MYINVYRFGHDAIWMGKNRGDYKKINIIKRIYVPKFVERETQMLWSGHNGLSYEDINREPTCMCFKMSNNVRDWFINTFKSIELIS